METNKVKERGQVLVLLVLGVVVLLGFVALAIDGGMVYSDRRLSQNATDASSMAGGGEAALSLENAGIVHWKWNNCSQANLAMSNAVAEAIAQAGINDFVIDSDPSDHNGATAVCQFDDYGSYVDKYIDVTTLISFTTDTSFIHFVYNGPMRNQVEAVTRVRPRNFVGYGKAIIAHRTDCPNQNTGGVHFDGNGDVDVNGGGIFSNACMKATGSVEVDVKNGKIGYVTEYDESGNPDVSPTPKQGAKLPDFTFPYDPPDCSGLDPKGGHSGEGNLTPGEYSNIKLNNGVLNMAPGLYCLSGDFTITGGEVYADGVTLFFKEGNFSSSGSALIQLSAPSKSPDPSPALAGMLIYLAEGNDGSASLLGNGDSYYIGTVYGADEDSMVEVGGTGSELETFQTQLIAGTVFIHGNATVEVKFKGEKSFEIPALVELYK